MAGEGELMGCALGFIPVYCCPCCLSLCIMTAGVTAYISHVGCIQSYFISGACGIMVMIIFFSFSGYVLFFLLSKQFLCLISLLMKML